MAQETGAVQSRLEETYPAVDALLLADTVAASGGDDGMHGAAQSCSKLVAVEYGGGIYTSSNSGTTWTQTSAPSHDWVSVASSSDGSKLVAAADLPNRMVHPADPVAHTN